MVWFHLQCEAVASPCLLPDGVLCKWNADWQIIMQRLIISKEGYVPAPVQGAETFGRYAF